jgi:hypothetical protein
MGKVLLSRDSDPTECGLSSVGILAGYTAISLDIITITVHYWSSDHSIRSGSAGSVEVVSLSRPFLVLSRQSPASIDFSLISPTKEYMHVPPPTSLSPRATLPVYTLRS